MMAELVRRGLFVERRDMILQGEPDHGFAQAACQEVAYRNLPRARRRALHKAAAAWLERSARGAGGLHEDVIAHHFREAGELARALPYARRAAERAIRTHAIEEAVRLLQSCREIVAQIPGAELLPQARERQLVTIAASLAHQLVLLGDLQRAVALADEVLPGGTASDRETSREVARLLIWKGWAQHHQGRYADARAAFVAAQQRLSGERSLLGLMALTGEMGATVHLGEQGDCADRLRRTLAEHHAAPASQEWERGLSSAHRVLANQELHVGRYDVCEEEYRTAYDLSLSANAPVEAVDALNGLAALYYFRGQLDRAESAWRMAVAQAEQWDLLQHRSVILSNLGELELARCDTTKARATLQHAEALFRHLGSERGLSETHRALCECHLLLGELDEAKTHAEKGLSLAERLRSPYMLGAVHRTAARVMHALWKRDGAPEALEAVRRHLDASAAALGAAGMQKLADETNALRGELLGG
jgi:tetratricopeptide (TPR) repeat protein